MKAKIVDNFFRNFKSLEEPIKKIKLYSVDDLKKVESYQNVNESWPGKRSKAIENENPILFNLFGIEMMRSFGHIVGENINMTLRLHLRLEEDNAKDFIHTDHFAKYNLIVYLNDNLDSGTNIYEDDSDKPSISVRSIKNRAVLLDAKSRHGSIKNYGNSIQDGRLTLLAFIF